jgi:hypothetical protein
MLTSAQMEKPNSKKIRAEVCIPTATFICSIQWTARLGSARVRRKFTPSRCSSVVDIVDMVDTIEASAIPKRPEGPDGSHPRARK